MMVNTKRMSDESYFAYLKRITELCEDKLITYEDWSTCIIGERKYGDENARKGFYILNLVIKSLASETSEPNLELEDIERQKLELMIERKKTQRINLEFNQNLRYMGDHELYVEMVKEAIERMEPIKIIPSTIKTRKLDTTGMLFISDAHYGKEFTIKGLFGETINEYSPDMFKARMWKLLSDFDNDFKDMPVDKIKVLDCGDAVEGILRATSSLQKLKVGVIDSAMEYAEFMSVWLCELYNRVQVPVEYSITGGNHDIVRILSSKKDFDGENIAKTIHAHIEQRVEISKLKCRIETGIIPDIEIREYSDITFNTVHGLNVLTYHGDTKNMKEDIEFFENFYQIDVDILIAGHLHRGSSETLGYAAMGDREIIRVPSIVGVDDYAKSIRKASRAGSLYMTFNEDGKQWQKTYYLN
jgi:hypothetical protein